MLRITDVRETMADGTARWTLRLDGPIHAEWVNELGRAWRAVRLAAAGASIRVVLGEVRIVDDAGRALLMEMHRDGVGIVATDAFTAGSVDEILGRERP